MPEKIDRTPRVSSHWLAVMPLFVCSFAAVPAHADCTGAHLGAAAASLPEMWHAALDALIASTAEPGHPWSCAGGTIDLEPSEHGGTLVVARAGEAEARRIVATPEEVLPLGQALLALPLSAASEPAPEVAAATEPRPSAPERPAALPAAPATRSAPATRRLLLAAGVDARGVGGSGVAWLGPAISAGVLLGRWLPSIALRQQSSISDGPSVDEVSVAFALQLRFPFSPFELRSGFSLRGAVVARDLPGRHGEQNRLEGRGGLLFSLAFAALSWANLVLAPDGDVVLLARETAAPEASTSARAPARFPTYSLGGSVWFEVPL